MDEENKAIKQAKMQEIKYKPIVLSNGDKSKQLLARSSYIIAKKPINLTENQKIRIDLLFKLYPELEKAHKHTLEFRPIYENSDQLKTLQRFNNTQSLFI